MTNIPWGRGQSECSCPDMAKTYYVAMASPSLSTEWTLLPVLLPGETGTLKPSAAYPV